MDVLSEAVKAIAISEHELNEIEHTEVDEILAAEVAKQLDRIEEEGSSKSSLDQARRYGAQFQEFVHSKGFMDRIETCSESKLNTYLRYFYGELRSARGTYLSPTTLGCIRAGIQRYLASSAVSRVVDIINGKAFGAANRMLRAIFVIHF